VKRLLLVLFWSVITAAFIGPGTVTTCASAGASHGLALLWALLFSIVACLTLQEASARITVVSGHDLGQAIRSRFVGRATGAFTLLLVLGAIVLGCAAYEAGNIIGAVAGASLGLEVPRSFLTLLTSGAAGALLWFAAIRTVARFLGVIVGIMGAVFLVTAALLAPEPQQILRGLLVPVLPRGSGLLVLGLIGTTVVPYNLFLGSGLARGQSLPELRFGISIAVILGGAISMGVMAVGTAVEGPLSFESLAGALAAHLGEWAVGLFALGLLAAGFSSAMTAPLAAAVTARSLFSRDGASWQERSWRYRIIWLTVLLVGTIFGLSGVQPIPAILLAQALNGVLLPFISVFLMILVNDRTLMGDGGINGRWANVLMGITVTVTVVLGTSGVMRACASAMGISAPGERTLITASSLVALFVGAWIVRLVFRARS